MPRNTKRARTLPAEATTTVELAVTATPLQPFIQDPSSLTLPSPPSQDSLITMPSTIAASPPTSTIKAKRKPKPLPSANSFADDRLPELQAKALQIQQQLQKLYPSPPIPLHQSSAFQLLVGSRDPDGVGLDTRMG